jgi:hypothetical protein
MMRGMANVSLAGKHQKAAAPQRTSAPSSRNATKVCADQRSKVLPQHQCTTRKLHKFATKVTI